MVGAALTNALRVVGKDMGKVKVVLNGAGSAGCAIAQLLLKLGVTDLTLVDRMGVLRGDVPGMNPEQARLAALTNPRGLSGKLADAMVGADVFIGVSAPGLVTREMVAAMAPGAVVFAMANPTPEIMPEEALAGGAAVVGTGRSDYPNQINNVLAFPGIFRGALDCRARDINEAMQSAASRALADYVGDRLSPTCILPNALDRQVAMAVAEAVARAARETGVARK